MIKQKSALKIPAVKIPRIAFLGVGWIGKNRLDAIAESGLGEISFIADPVKSIRDSLKQQYSSAHYGASIDDIINNEDIDGVVIATPSAFHSAQSIKLLNKGIPVFCQKPLGRNSEETELAVQTAHANNKLLGVDLSYRFTEAFRIIYDVIKSGEIGHIFAVDLIFHNAYGPDKDWFYNKDLSGGGCLIDLGTHLIDLALYVLDFPPIKSAYSKLYSNGEPLKSTKEVEDYVVAVLELFNGTSIRLNCSWNVSAGCDAVIEASFHGSRGGASFHNVNGSFYDFQADLFKGTSKEVLVTPPDNWQGRAAVDWVKKLSKDDKFDSSAFEYVYTARVLEKIYKVQ